MVARGWSPNNCACIKHVAVTFMCRLRQDMQVTLSSHPCIAYTTYMYVYNFRCGISHINDYIGDSVHYCELSLCSSRPQNDNIIVNSAYVWKSMYVIIVRPLLILILVSQSHKMSRNEFSVNKHESSCWFFSSHDSHDYCLYIIIASLVSSRLHKL